MVANHGLAIGDVNGDQLEDLYICQQGGVPNRLFLQNPDGTLRDFTAESETGWLDYCASALIVDLDNDGDKDLVVSQDFKMLFMDNVDGKGRFELAFGHGTKAQTFSISATDFDLDGRLDIYACGYNPSATTQRAGAMGEPVPFHDANNGGPNLLFRNAGNWEFEDVTTRAGLDVNNRRFSFGASWEDYDNDGDLDLYVANDFGRNNLYRNDSANGRFFFREISDALGVQDTSAGMSTNWADYNRDGWMDLYISNMFSGAGNRITYQKQFLSETSGEVREQFQRMARGNTLFRGD
ncbi:MAG: VCBS repeat-containing protein, partial [Akkermansiaceae bacterium]|nr:VCBS repeat-containing protein [Akkermansiaceae bacterium]